MNNSYIELLGKSYELLVASHPDNDSTLSSAFCEGYKTCERDRAVTNKSYVDYVARAMMETVFHKIDVSTASLDWTGNDVWGCDFEAMSKAAIVAMNKASEGKMTEFEKVIFCEREVLRRYQNAVKKAITYLSEQIDGDSPTLDQTLSQAIRILEGNDL